VIGGASRLVGYPSLRRVNPGRRVLASVVEAEAEVVPQGIQVQVRELVSQLAETPNPQLAVPQRTP
jgi:hypothetical protein